MKGGTKLLLFVAGVIATLAVAEACNEAICGPIVSKCMLINCCDCDLSDLKNCSCCRECQICLKALYTECCSCVGLCPLPDPEDDLGKSSTVEDLPDPIPDLFNVLTEFEDPHKRWTTFTFAVDLDKLLLAPEVRKARKEKTKMKIVPPEPKDEKPTKTASEKDAEKEKEEDQEEEIEEHVLGIRNCTVAYFAKCLSIRKCKESCKSMGAAKYRWFHEHGCCECVGSSCFDYGLNTPKCLYCPEDQSHFYNDDWRDNSVYKMEKDTFSHTDGYLDTV